MFAFDIPLTDDVKMGGENMGKIIYQKLKQSVLRTKYECYGHFYTVVLRDKSKIKCRSVLEIVAKPFEDQVQELSLKQPDAIFVMMNPGSSEPDLSQIENYKEEEICTKAFDIDFWGKELVAAIPDDTQDRIMNVMHVLNWNHVRILNLSDIREKNSLLLQEHFRKFRNNDEVILHSIFSDQRTRERIRAFGWKNGESQPPIIAAWGTLQCLNKVLAIAETEITSNAPQQLYGIRKNKSRYFFHPGRRKNWHNDIIDQLSILSNPAVVVCTKE